MKQKARTKSSFKYVQYFMELQSKFIHISTNSKPKEYFFTMYYSTVYTYSGVNERKNLWAYSYPPVA